MANFFVSQDGATAVNLDVAPTIGITNVGTHWFVASGDVQLGPSRATADEAKTDLVALLGYRAPEFGS